MRVEVQEARPCDGCAYAERSAGASFGVGQMFAIAGANGEHFVKHPLTSFLEGVAMGESAKPLALCSHCRMQLEQARNRVSP